LPLHGAAHEQIDERLALPMKCKTMEATDHTK